MTSPARRHAMRVSAEKASQREQHPLRHATAYEQMLVKLAADRRTLSQIHSKERKADKKRELLPFYQPWVTGVLETGTGAQDDILMTVLLWRLDAGDITGAIDIARYALRYGLSMPDGHSRTAPYMLSEEVALAALRARAACQPVDVQQLLNVIEMTRTADMPDEVRARLHKVAGLILRDVGRLSEAMSHLQRAIQLDGSCGVKKDIERLGRELRQKPVVPVKKAPLKTAQKVTKKTTDSPAKRGPGRPRKAAG